MQLGFLVFVCATMKDICKASELQLDQARGKSLATHDVKAVFDGDIGYGSRLKVNVRSQLFPPFLDHDQFCGGSNF